MAGSARRLRLPLVALALLTAGLAGCQAPQAVSTLPKPNWEAPVVRATPPRSLPPAGNVRSLPAPDQTAMVNGVPRNWIPPVKPNRWYWIVIHHTATPAGALSRIDASHRSKGWDEAGYHFVIGNGTESRDGQIEVGPRWPKQKRGAHTASADNRFNEHGIGIVMVGNFDETRPSKAQLESCARLVAYLMRTYRVPADRVLGHRDAKATDCPGKHTSVAQIRQAAVRILADAGEPIPTASRVASAAPGTELLQANP